MFRMRKYRNKLNRLSGRLRARWGEARREDADTGGREAWGKKLDLQGNIPV
jgi:hypothetical protein